MYKLPVKLNVWHAMRLYFWQMSDMLFGNWKVTEDSIIWNGGELSHFRIPSNQLINTRRVGDAFFYEWILLVTNEDWLSEDDLYDFNYAFVYAAAQFKLDLNYETFDATLAEQYDQLEEEEEDEDEF